MRSLLLCLYIFSRYFRILFSDHKYDASFCCLGDGGVGYHVQYVEPQELYSQAQGQTQMLVFVLDSYVLLIWCVQW